MIEEVKMLADHGYLIYGDGEGYMLHKTPTPKDNTVGVTTETGTHTHVPCVTYQEAVNLALCSMGVKPRETYFAAEVRFDRGLGWEYRVLDGVLSTKFSTARRMARTQAEEYFSGSEEFRAVSKFDVRIRPGTLD